MTMVNSESDEVNKMTQLVTGKNPLSVIHEYCQSNNVRATYVVDDEEGSPHCKLFTITCTVSDLKTTGVGKSKREAKLSAATTMIEQLKTNGLMDMKNVEGKRQKLSKKIKLSNDYSSSKIAENPVGFLQEYCLYQELNLPSYTEEPSELGYSIICSLNNVSCQGVDQKKKKAKADAAKQMCELLIKKKISIQKGQLHQACNNEINNNKNEHSGIEDTSKL